MQASAGTVVDGKIVVDGMLLAEGAVVTILSREPDAPFVISADDERELISTTDEIERGELMSPEELFVGLRQFGRK